MDQSASQNYFPQPARNLRQANRLGAPSGYGSNHGETLHLQGHIESSSTGKQFQSVSASFSPGDGDFPNYPTPARDTFQPRDGVVLGGKSGNHVLSTGREPDLDSFSMSRFWNSKPQDPWILRDGVEGVNSWSTTGDSTVRTLASYGEGYREAALSNPESYLTKGQQDSGYQTGNRSAYSDMYGAEESHSLIDAAHGMNLSLGDVYAGGSQSGILDNTSENAMSQQTAPHISPPSRCNQPQCRNLKNMNLSEYKKHMQKHIKPWICFYRNCSRIEGFTTKNDLYRHMKSRHKIAPANNDRSFICQGVNCNKKDKEWPRFDNFKSHCKRMHGEENLEELIKKSKRITSGHQPPSAPTQPEHDDRQWGVEQDEANEVNAQVASVLCAMSQDNPGLQETSTRTTSVGRPRASSDSMHIREHSSSQTSRLNVGVSLMPEIGRVHRAPYPQGTPEMYTQDNSQTEPIISISPSPHERHLISQFYPETPRSPKTNEGPTESLQPTNNNQRVRNQIYNVGISQEKLEELCSKLASTAITDFHKHDPSHSSLQSLFLQDLRIFLSHSKPSNKRTSSDADLSGPSLSRASKRIVCSICDKQMGRPCDLKKHEKRHSRPWGCTNEECNKSFGSKNDWKRHENSQHYQLETWRCHEPCSSSKIKQCAKIFFRRDPFVQHLRKDHDKRDEEYVKGECRSRRIGRNWQSGFWCGFCRSIVKLSKKGLEAWDERFNHIDDMHFKQGKNIDEWYPLDKDIPKGRLRQEKKNKKRAKAGGGPKGGRGGAGEEEDDDDDDDEESELEYGVAEGKGRPLDLPDPPPVPPPPLLTRQPPKRKHLNADWYCSQCHFGPLKRATDTHCTVCGVRG